MAPKTITLEQWWGLCRKAFIHEYNNFRSHPIEARGYTCVGTEAVINTNFDMISSKTFEEVQSYFTP